MSNVPEQEARMLQGLKGQRLGPYLSHNPVSATQIWQWCSAMGDNNPCYHRGPGQIAPPAMMQMWTMRDINDCYAPGSTSAAPYRVFDEMRTIGYAANVAVSYDISFHHYLRVGDRPRHFTSVVNISERKSTRLGTGYFVTERVEYLTQDDVLFADALITYFQYQPAAAEGNEPVAPAPQAPAVDEGAAPEGGAPGWQPDYSDLDIAGLQLGDVLPELHLPVTHKLIVGGAIATQDFIPVHHNLPAAQAAGMPDIFMNILTTSGLSARYLGDWAGAGSRLEKIAFSLMVPNFPGDVMVMRGTINAIEPRAAGAAVSVEFSGSNRRGLHTSGTATLALPGKRTTV